jgi:hypothetical protein
MSASGKVISHEITIEFKCPKTKEDVKMTISSPTIGTGHHYEDWEYTLRISL